MSDDLVKRLRYQADEARKNYPEVFRVSEEIAYEAADCIEKLEAQLARSQLKRWAARWEEQADRIEQLEAALRTVKEWHGYGLPLETTRIIDAALEGKDD